MGMELTDGRDVIFLTCSLPLGERDERDLGCGIEAEVELDLGCCIEAEVESGMGSIEGMGSDLGCVIEVEVESDMLPR